MSVSYWQWLQAQQPAKNNLTGAAIALVALKAGGALGKKTTGRRFVDGRNGSDAGNGSEEKPFKTLGAATAAIPPPTSKPEYETPQEIVVAPGDYSAEAAVTFPTFASFRLVAPQSFLPKLNVKPSSALQFGSVVPPTYVVAGGEGDATLAPLFADTDQPTGLAKFGDGAVAFKVQLDTANPVVPNVHFFNTDFRGSILFEGDWFAGPGSPYLTFTNCNLQSTGAGLEQGTGASTPVGVVGFWNCTVSQAGYVVDVEVVSAFVVGFANGTWNVQGVASPPFLRGFQGVFTPATFTWVGPVLSMFLDGVTNYWVTTNAATVAAGDKVVTEDDTP